VSAKHGETIGKSAILQTSARSYTPVGHIIIIIIIGSPLVNERQVLYVQHVK